METEKFYLRIPNAEANDYDTYLNYNIQKGTYFISDDAEMLSEGFQTKFTKEEIEKLPKQDFIQVLEKEKIVVEGWK